MKKSLEKIGAGAARGETSGKKFGAGGGQGAGVGQEDWDPVNCPVRQVLDRIGDKWSTLVILLLKENGVMRFNEISQSIGDISQKMLTVTLRNLEGDGLVSRKMYPEIPPRVEYELTELGKSLLPLIRELVAWADQNIQTIKRNRTRYANQKSSLSKVTA